jgi:hypothetical protein
VLLLLVLEVVDDDVVVLMLDVLLAVVLDVVVVLLVIVLVILRVRLEDVELDAAVLLLSDEDDEDEVAVEDGIEDVFGVGEELELVDDDVVVEEPREGDKAHVRVRNEHECHTTRTKCAAEIHAAAKSCNSKHRLVGSVTCEVCPLAPISECDTEPCSHIVIYEFLFI